MDRRRFLGMLAMAAAGTAIGYDPLTAFAQDGLTRHFFVPPPPRKVIPCFEETVESLDPQEFIDNVNALYDGKLDDAAFEAFAGLDWMTHEVLKQMVDRIGRVNPVTHLMIAQEFGQRMGDTVQVPTFDEIRVKRGALVWPERHSKNVVLDRQYSVAADLTALQVREGRRDPNVRDRIRHQMVVPMAEQLAGELKRRNLKVMGALPMLTMQGVESVIAVDNASKIAVRGIRHYDHMVGKHMLRFDILGGIY